MILKMEDANNLLLPGRAYKVRYDKTKAEVRYRLYRKRKEMEDGIIYDLEEEVLEYFEEQEDFLGWEHFAIFWDVEYKDGVWACYIRETSEYDEWNQTVRILADILPTKSRVKARLKREKNNGSES